MVVGGDGFIHMSMPVAVPSTAFVCCQLICGIADSDPTAVMDVRLLCFLCVV